MNPRWFVVAIVVALLGLFSWKLIEGQNQPRLPLQTLLELEGNSFDGAYVATTAGCVACHTDTENGGALLSGGVAFETPFGTIYSPNITSDVETGIGGWSTQEFATAMLTGLSPKGEHYYPAFPYTAYSVMSAQELVDLKAWLDTVEPVASVTPEHDLPWPLSNRLSVTGWKVLFFDAQRTVDPEPRGAYLVNGPGHCAECHASRNVLGGVTDRALGGNQRGPGGDAVPGITAEHLVDWTVEDLDLFLEVGITPDGDFSGGHMADVIEYSTGLLYPADRKAMARYLLSSANGS